MAGSRRAVWTHSPQWITSRDLYKALILCLSKRKKTQRLEGIMKWITFNWLPLGPIKSDSKRCFLCRCGICMRDYVWKIVFGFTLPHKLLVQIGDSLVLGLLTKLSFIIHVNTSSTLNQTCLEALFLGCFFSEPHSEHDTNTGMNIWILMSLIIKHHHLLWPHL